MRDRSRGVSEAMGVGVLIGMTVLITASLGAGVLLISDGPQGEETAEIDFNLLSNRLAVVYEDDTPRAAGKLFLQGPENNVSWAELDESRGPEDAVEGGSAIFLGPDTAYGANVGPTDRIEVIFITEQGERVVLATWTGPEGSGGGGGQAPGGQGGPGG